MGLFIITVALEEQRQTVLNMFSVRILCPGMSSAGTNLTVRLSTKASKYYLAYAIKEYYKTIHSSCIL